MHRPSQATDVEETLSTLTDLIRQGKSAMSAPPPTPPARSWKQSFDVRAVQVRDGWAQDLPLKAIADGDLGLLGAMLGALAVFWERLLAGWIAVVTTITTALSAHIAASHYRFQQLEFTRTAEQLELPILMATGTPAGELSQVVAEGERSSWARTEHGRRP